MAKVTVKSVGAIIDGRPIGSSFELDERTAKRLESLGYVKITGKVTEPKKVSAKPKGQPKKSPKTKPKTVDKTK